MDQDQLSAALAKAKASFRVASQSGHNPFFKSATHPKGAPYSTTADIDAAISQALCAEGFAPVTVHPRREDGQWIAQGVLRHRSGQQITAEVPMFIQKLDMQGFKSALTYAQRMLIVCLTGCVSGTDDDDGNAASQPAQAQQKGDPARRAVQGMTAEAELRAAIDAGDEKKARVCMDKVRLRAKRKEIDEGLLQRAEAAFAKAFAEEVASV
jgi:hypothetical protein